MIPRSNTEPALDLDALLGGLRPVLKGLDGAKINAVSNALIELLQGKGGTLSAVLAHTADFTNTIASRGQLIDHTIDNLNTVLAAADQKSVDLDTSVDQLQQLITTLSHGREPISNALQPLAAAEHDLTDVLSAARRPFQAVITNAAHWHPHSTIARRTSTPPSNRSRRTTCCSAHLAPTARSSTSTSARSRSRSADRPGATSSYPR